MGLFDEGIADFRKIDHPLETRSVLLEKCTLVANVAILHRCVYLSLSYATSDAFIAAAAPFLSFIHETVKVMLPCVEKASLNVSFDLCRRRSSATLTSDVRPVDGDRQGPDSS